MKENNYDQDAFFEKYRRFPRSVEGLKAAGEWPAFKRLLPDFKGQRVLDIGCGFGWHCTYAANHGAEYVLGIDISLKMLAQAWERTLQQRVDYQMMPMEEMDFPANSFDIVLSSLAFHYTPDFDLICRKVNQCLAPGGSFVFSVEHPIFTAEGQQEWIYDEAGQAEYWPVDHYFTEGKREANFLGEQVVKYHHTLSTYLNTLLQNGFEITEVVEPTPAEHLLETVPEMKEELRRPMMLLIGARKKG